jgi:hypothetical protein
VGHASLWSLISDPFASLLLQYNTGYELAHPGLFHQPLLLILSKSLVEINQLLWINYEFIKTFFDGPAATGRFATTLHFFLDIEGISAYIYLQPRGGLCLA